MFYKGGSKHKFAVAELVAVFFVTSVLMLTVFRSGTFTQYGLSFWGPNGHDAVFHLSLIRSMVNNIGFENPLFFGSQLNNYHVGFDLITAALFAITNINLFDLFFRWIPLGIATTLCLLALRLMDQLGFSKWERIAGLIGLSLLGSAGFLKTIFGGDLFGGESLFWANQSVSVLLNPPFALSVVFLLSWLSLMASNSKRHWWAIYLLPSLVFHIKAYAGLLMIGALTLDFLYRFLIAKKREREEIVYLVIGLLLFTLSASLVLGKTSLVVFEPIWFIRQLISSPDRLYSMRLASAYDNWLSSGSLIKLSILQLLTIVIFVFGNFWIRILGIYRMAKLINKRVSRVMFFITLMGIVVPLLFIQKGTPWNTIQFMYYSLAFSGIFTGKFIVERMRESRNIKPYLFWFAIMLVGCMTTYGTVRDYLSPIPASYIGYDEIRLLSMTDGGALATRPFDSADKRRFVAPLPLYVYESTAYTGLFGRSSCATCDEVNLTIMGYDYKPRLNQIKVLYGSSDPEKVSQIAKEIAVSYLYIDPVSKIRFDPALNSYRMIASSGGFQLWQKIE